MILLDTNVLIYAQELDSPFRNWSQSTIGDAVAGGGAAINPIILAELCVGDAKPALVLDRVRQWGITFLDLKAEVAPLAAKAFARYLEARRLQAPFSGTRTPLPDFFIGAQAAQLGIPLATADRGRYQTYFPEVVLIVPDLP